jgi:hypothetical protein
MKSAVTTYNKPKPFAWSYSKLKNFESCPKRHWHLDIAKDVKEEEGEALIFGNELHKAMARRVEAGTALPQHFREYEPWAAKVSTPGGKLLVEQKFAIAADFSPVEFFARNVWFRGIADVLRIHGPVALVIDWKTGKIKEDSVQLALTAQCVFSHYPDVHAVRTEFVWLAEDATTRADFKRGDMPAFWADLWPRISALEQAHKLTEYPAKPGALCRRWCPVTKCPHHGV